MPAAHRAKLPGYGRFFDAPNRMIEMVFAGVFDRFPELDVVFAEVDFGWVPYVKEQIDNNYQRLDPVSRFGLQRRSERLHRPPLPLRLHHRHVRAPQPRQRRRRTGPVVERLPAHQRRLADLVAHDPVVDVGHRGRATAQLIPPATRSVSTVSEPLPWRRRVRGHACCGQSRDEGVAGQGLGIGQRHHQDGRVQPGGGRGRVDRRCDSARSSALVTAVM